MGSINAKDGIGVNYQHKSINFSQISCIYLYVFLVCLLVVQLISHFSLISLSRILTKLKPSAFIVFSLEPTLHRSIMHS
jgi:hypothetical protein